MLSGRSSCHSVGDILLSSGGKSILLVKKKRLPVVVFLYLRT